MRAEVYVNQKLAAYDIIGETPFSFEIGEFIIPGEGNTIAVRLTNPGGRRGWKDIPLDWGNYQFNSNGRNFTTLGNVCIEANPKAYIADVFVKNILPAKAKQVEVTATIQNHLPPIENVKIEAVFSGEDGQIANHSQIETLKAGSNQIIFTITLSDTELWSPDNPDLYEIELTLKSDKVTDTYCQSFGVRTFQVLPGRSGEHNFYLNGKRFFFRSAVDWGFYAPTGDYATPELAMKSVKAAKALNQNGIHFHRAIGEPLVMSFADSIGICISEEPGGFHGVRTAFGEAHIKEKIRRMVIRDRNHPSLLLYTLSNEDHTYTDARESSMRMIQELDNSRLITNSSGYDPLPTKHIRPYESEIRNDYIDDHTPIGTSARYPDTDFFNTIHRSQKYTDKVYVLGEMTSVSGPANWYQVYEDNTHDLDRRIGYSTNIYRENHQKIIENFDKWKLSKVGSGNIKTYADVSMQCGRGMMYAQARHSQSAMCNNHVDGAVLNGWTPGPMSEGGGGEMDFDSGMLDEGRNLKGPAGSFTNWTRPLQIAIARKNGKYFSVKDTAIFEVNLINQGILKAGKYELDFHITDETGTNYIVDLNMEIDVIGGDYFAQELGDIEIPMKADWHGGYITVNAILSKSGKDVADGSEQVLFANRDSYQSYFEDVSFNIITWPEAQQAMEGKGKRVEKHRDQWHIEPFGKEGADFILVGDFSYTEDFIHISSMLRTPAQLAELFKRIQAGSNALIQFDEHWAEIFYNYNILSKPVREWGGKQPSQWYGNGWGYLDHFNGYSSIANKGTIGTNAWEVSSDPVGFYPFESEFSTSVYGLFMSRPWVGKEPAASIRIHDVSPTMLVTLATIDYGKGKIIICPGYNVDEQNAFTDMLFYNIIDKAIKEEW